MDTLVERLKTLSSAEDFLQFFGVPFDEAVVHVKRLHILKRFYQYLHQGESLAGLGEIELFRRYRELLARAYQDFVDSTPAREKVFKVFHDAEGKQGIALESLRSNLAERRAQRAA